MRRSKRSDLLADFPSLGNPSDTAVTAMTTDAAGNIYLTGWTEEPTLAVTPGVVQPKFSGGSCTNGNNGPNPTPPPTFTCPDAFVVKLDTHGKIVFATYLGGDELRSGYVDRSRRSGQHLYRRHHHRLPDVAGSKFTGGATFIAKLNPSATALLYTASIPGTGPLPLSMPFGPNTPPADVTMSMAVDAAGNAYFAAKSSSGFPVTANAIESTGGIVVGKLDPTGQNLVYATYLGGSAGNDNPGGVALDASGNLYITGSTSSPDFPVTSGVLQSTLTPGNTNAFVAKLNPSGSALIVRHLSGRKLVCSRTV